MSFRTKNPLKLKGKAFGSLCEHIAIDYLQNEGYRIIERNFKIPQGEIDIIAQKDGYIIFVEVKGRKSTRYGPPHEAVTLKKQQIIRLVAKVYISQNGLESKKVRFDVLGITFSRFADKPEITHIPFAF